MPSIKLTKKFCDATQAPAVDGVLPEGEYSDTLLRGFQLRVLRSGTKQFVIRYRINGRRARHVLGDYGQLTVEQARTYAQKLLAEVKMGADPSAAKAEARKAWSVQQLVEHYRAEVLSKRAPKTQESYARHLDFHILPNLGKKPAAKVDRTDILQMFRAAERSARKVDEQGVVVNPGTTTANRVLATASVLFAEAIAQGIRIDNPCASVDRNQEHRRERFLSIDESARLFAACQRSPHRMAANLLLLLMFTGARKGETMRARWEQFNLDEAIWVKPGHQTKQRRLHAISLSSAAVEMLREMRASNEAGERSPWVFPGRKPDAPVASLKRSIGAVLKDAGLRDEGTSPAMRVVPHTLRHSYATQAISLGHSLSTVGHALGHTQAATTQRYAHAELDPQRKVADALDASRRAASERLRQQEAEAEALLAAGGNVVPMPMRKAG